MAVVLVVVVAMGLVGGDFDLGVLEFEKHRLRLRLRFLRFLVLDGMFVNL